jgi:hypothetical protein
MREGNQSLVVSGTFEMITNLRPFILMLLGIIPFSTGCISILSQADPPTEERKELLRQIPRYARAEVHVFLIEGGDPLELANLESVAEHMRGLGFGKVYRGHRKHVFAFYREMLCLKHEHPAARFVIIGYDSGAEMARRLAYFGSLEGLNIDSLIYLDPAFVCTTDTESANAPKQVEIYQSENPPEFTPTSEIVIRKIPSSHIGLPTDPLTVQMLRERITQIAESVPLIRYIPIDKPLVDPAPSPRIPVQHTEKDKPIDNWDFLRPRGMISLISTVPESAPTPRVSEKN